MNPIDILLSRLDGVKGNSPRYMAKCPSHEDKSPSLRVTSLDDGRVLIHCFAGCSAADVVASVGLELGDLFPKGPHGELTGKPFRRPENRLYVPGYEAMQSEIWKLRARLSAK